jgi:curved DNA-binding protein CbpA
MASYYATLGVARDASSDEIKRAYRRLVAEHHPDKHGGSVAAKRRFQAVAEAYAVLGDESKRRRYDLGIPPKRRRSSRSPRGSSVVSVGGFAFDGTGDPKRDLVRATTSLAELSIHSIKYGAARTVLLVACVITFMVMSSTLWTTLLSGLICLVLANGGAGWFRIIYKSPIIIPYTKKKKKEQST